MFYCDPCAARFGWPTTTSRSHGQCEVCDEMTFCSNRPSHTLPPARDILGDEWAELHDHED